MRSLLILSLLLASCTTPENWKPSDHAMMMQRCRVMCKNQAASYDAWIAECLCHKRRFNND